MIYLLDSNVWIAFFRATSPAVVARLKQHPSSEIVVCPMVLAELWYGVCRSKPTHRAANEALVTSLRTKYTSLPFDDTSALDSAELRAQLSAAGQQIGPYDLIIVAIARTHGATLVTHNTTEFARVPNSTIEDWQTT